MSAGLSPAEFSLERFEHLAYGRRHEHAARKLVEDRELSMQLSKAPLHTDPDCVLFEGAPEKFCTAVARLHERHRDAMPAGAPASPLSPDTARSVVQ